ncbi:transposase [Emticicia sp. BO119]|uniref:transposase n=1 Tax=Emticicia sp. BO119 TaxID=2757768 RepID=UPI0038D3AE69
MDSIVKQLQKSTIRVDGLFVNADAGFDTEDFRKVCLKHHIIANVPENKRNTISPKESKVIFDEEMYQCRYVIERTNAWCDSYRTMLIRQDTTRILGWPGIVCSLSFNG